MTQFWDVLAGNHMKNSTRNMADEETSKNRPENTHVFAESNSNVESNTDVSRHPFELYGYKGLVGNDLLMNPTQNANVESIAGLEQFLLKYQENMYSKLSPFDNNKETSTLQTAFGQKRDLPIQKFDHSDDPVVDSRPSITSPGEKDGMTYLAREEPDECESPDVAEPADKGCTVGAEENEPWTGNAVSQADLLPALQLVLMLSAFAWGALKVYLNLYHLLFAFVCLPMAIHFMVHLFGKKQANDTETGQSKETMHPLTGQTQKTGCVGEGNAEKRRGDAQCGRCTDCGEDSGQSGQGTGASGQHNPGTGQGNKDHSTGGASGGHSGNSGNDGDGDGDNGDKRRKMCDVTGGDEEVEEETEESEDEASKAERLQECPPPADDEVQVSISQLPLAYPQTAHNPPPIVEQYTESPVSRQTSHFSQTLVRLQSSHQCRGDFILTLRALIQSQTWNILTARPCTPLWHHVAPSAGCQIVAWHHDNMPMFQQMLVWFQQIAGAHFRYSQRRLTVQDDRGAMATDFLISFVISEDATNNMNCGGTRLEGNDQMQVMNADLPRSRGTATDDPFSSLQDQFCRWSAVVGRQILGSLPTASGQVLQNWGLVIGNDSSGRRRQMDSGGLRACGVLWAPCNLRSGHGADLRGSDGGESTPRAVGVELREALAECRDEDSRNHPPLYLSARTWGENNNIGLPVQCTDDTVGLPYHSGVEPAEREEEGGAELGAEGGDVTMPSPGSIPVRMVLKERYTLSAQAEDDVFADRIQRLRRENRQMIELYLCRHCRVNRFEVVLLPCGHFICCMCLSQYWNTCPCCGGGIEDYVVVRFQ